MSGTGITWKYSQLPQPWWQVGGGWTNKDDYPREEQFSGSEENIEDMKSYLTNYFDQLLSEGKIERFKIRDSYQP